MINIYFWDRKNTENIKGCINKKPVSILMENF